MRLDLCFMTGRTDPHLPWMLDSLATQLRTDDEIHLIVVDALDRKFADLLPDITAYPIASAKIFPPKPNIWQGKHRVTSRDWWATANARNTALCIARTDYIVFVDDRAHLGPGWLDAVRRASARPERDQSVICGSYDKIEGPADQRIISQDHRRKLKPEGLVNCGGGWLYGCTFGLPMAWALEVNGLEEGCDGLTGEDYIFGLMLHNAGHRIDFVPSMFVLQDRTPGNESCKGSYACRDKGVSPNDKSHAALARFGKRKQSEFTPNLRELRAQLARGEGFPVPSPAIEYRDWYDQQLIREMT